MTSLMYQLDPKFSKKAFLSLFCFEQDLKIVYRQKKNANFIVKPINCSLCSESKILAVQLKTNSFKYLQTKRTKSYF